MHMLEDALQKMKGHLQTYTTVSVAHNESNNMQVVLIVLCQP